MRKYTIALVAIFLNSYAIASDFCADLGNKAHVEQAYLERSKSIFEVISKNRLYFNSAPSNKCKVKDLFLVPGDKVIGYAEYDNFLSAAYFKGDGDSVDGWLDMTQLKNTGLTNGPSSEE